MPKQDHLFDYDLICAQRHGEDGRMEFLRNLSARHEQLKKKIHSTRIPLSKRGQTAMGVVYFTVPIVCGYFIMKWTERKADENFHKQENQIRHAAGSSTRYIEQQNTELKRMLEKNHNRKNAQRPLARFLIVQEPMSSAMDARVDAMERKLREIFEVKSGYKDTPAQAMLLAKHFKYFDMDESGVIDFDEFSRAMIKVNFVGVQAEVEALFDRFDEDLNGVVSYSEFARAVIGTGTSGSYAQSDKNKTLLQRVKDRILDAGGRNGIRTLGVILRRMDQNGNGVIEIEEFHDGLMELGLDDMDPAELERVFRCFDNDQNGRITVSELMRGLRGSMSKRRIKLIKQAFSLLDTSGDGSATIDEVEQLYDASHHPEVLAGRMKPRDALLEFMRVFEEAATADGTITWREFLLYYKDLSAGMANDDEFELMMRNAWHMSGGTGWAANSTCRRVLVTFRDGSQRVVEVENDLGVSAKNKRVIIQRLERQGIQNIADISFAQ